MKLIKQFLDLSVNTWIVAMTKIGDLGPRASDRHAADAGSIPRCGTGFFSQSQLSVKTLSSLTCVRTPPCAVTRIDIGGQVKDRVVHVRVWWIMETLKHPACTQG